MWGGGRTYRGEGTVRPPRDERKLGRSDSSLAERLGLGPSFYFVASPFGLSTNPFLGGSRLQTAFLRTHPLISKVVRTPNHRSIEEAAASTFAAWRFCFRGIHGSLEVCEPLTFHAIFPGVLVVVTVLTKFVHLITQSDHLLGRIVTDSPNEVRCPAICMGWRVQ